GEDDLRYGYCIRGEDRVGRLLVVDAVAGSGHFVAVPILGVGLEEEVTGWLPKLPDVVMCLDGSYLDFAGQRGEMQDLERLFPRQREGESHLNDRDAGGARRDRGQPR